MSRSRHERRATLGLAEACLMPVEAAAFPLARLGKRLFPTGYFPAILDQLKMRRAFRPRWTKQSLRAALGLVETVDRTLTSAGIPYMAYAGTLLGVHRHRGVVPWDDDLDLCLAGEDLPRFLALRETFRAEGIEIVAANGCHKLFLSAGRPIDAQSPWSWPFIDMFVWDQIGSRLVIRNFGDHYPFASFHPLQRAPFHHLTLPVPRDTEPVLASWYGPGFMNRAFSPSYNHRREKVEPRRHITSIYPLPRWQRFFSRRHRPLRVLNEMLLRAAAQFMERCGVRFWLDYGTLLADYRIDGHLPYHDDVDLGMMEDEYPLLLRQTHLLDPEYEFYDTSHRHDGPKGGIMHRKFGGNCDFYTYRQLENGCLRICLGPDWRGTMDARDIPADLVFPLEPTRMDGLSVLRPCRPREYLEHRYGFLDYPAVPKDDGTGHYRSAWKQPSWEEQSNTLSSASQLQTT